MLTLGFTQDMNSSVLGGSPVYVDPSTNPLTCPAQMFSPSICASHTDAKELPCVSLCVSITH